MRVGVRFGKLVKTSMAHGRSFEGLARAVPFRLLNRNPKILS